MYANDYEPGEWQMTGWERVLEEKIKPRHPFALYLKSEFERACKPVAEVRRWVVSHLGFDSAMINRWLEGNSIMKPEIYQSFRGYLGHGFLCRPYEELRAEYEELRAEYEELRRPFDNFMGLTDVLKFPQDAYKNGAPGHETPKPEKLTRALILTCSRPGNLVLAPFCGSGTEVAMAARERRRWVGYDIEGKYVSMANERTTKETRQVSVLDFQPGVSPVFEQAKMFED